jgi:outer membrane protein TolC
VQGETAAQTQPSTGGGALTVDAAISLALAHNRELAGAALGVDSAQDAIVIARRRRLPQFDVDAQLAQQLTTTSYTFPAGAFGTYEATGPIPGESSTVESPRKPSFYANATVAQPLTQLLRLNIGVAASETSRDIERERLRTAEQKLASDVRRVYYTLLQTESALIASNESITVAQEFSRVMRARLSEQAALKADGLDADLSVARAQQRHLALTHTRETQAEQLNRLLGRDLATPVTLVPVPGAASGDDDLETLTARALDARPEIREARLRVTQAQLDLRSKTAERIPDVSLTVSYITFLNMDVLPRNLGSVGVQVSWEPFDWGRRRREAAMKARAVEQARLAQTETEAGVAAEVSASLRRVREARSGLQVARLAELAARERARVKVELLRVKATLQPDALQAQAQLVDAAASHQEALSSYWTARADFDRAIGENVR